MIKPNQSIEISWTQTAQHFFGELGYTLTKGNTIFVSPEELPKGSHRRVQIICDGCGKELEMEYRQYINKRVKFDGKYYCSKCGSGAEETKRKRKNTCLQKYQCDNPMRNAEIAAKCAAALNSGEGVPTSRQQKEVFNILLSRYPNTILNYLEGSLSLDCMCNINGQNVDIEYDGWYWHKHAQRDIKRDKFLQSKGYKVLRIKSGKLIPDAQELFNALDVLVNSDISYKEIVLPDYKKEEITN